MESKRMWECYLDGVRVRSFDTEDEAENWCYQYDGEEEATYEYTGDTGIDEPCSDCGPF